MLRRSIFLSQKQTSSRIHASSSSTTPPQKFHPLRLFGDVTCPFTHRCTIVAAHKRVPLEVFEISNRNKPEWWDEFFQNSHYSSLGRKKGQQSSPINNSIDDHDSNNNNNSNSKQPCSLVGPQDMLPDFSAPILQVGSQFIRDSKVISEYLDATYPPTHSLLPPMPHIRAHVRQFQSACADLIDAMYDYLHFNPNFHSANSPNNNNKNNNNNNDDDGGDFTDGFPNRKSAASSILPIVKDSEGNVIIQQNNISSALMNENASSTNDSSSNHNKSESTPTIVATKTTSGKARGRKKSVLATKIFLEQLNLPKTSDYQDLIRSFQEKIRNISNNETSNNITSKNAEVFKYNVTEESLLRDLRYQLRRVEAYLDHSASPFLLGSTPSLGDMTLIPFIDRFRFVLAAAKKFYLLEEAPALGRLMQAAEMLSSFQRTRLNAQEYLDAFDYLLVEEEDGNNNTSTNNNGVAKTQREISVENEAKQRKRRISRRVEIFTPPIESCPWSDAVRLTAALKNIEYNERPIKEFAQYEQKLIQNLRASHHRHHQGGGSDGSAAGMEVEELEDERLMMNLLAEKRGNPKKSFSSHYPQSPMLLSNNNNNNNNNNTSNNFNSSKCIDAASTSPSFNPNTDCISSDSLNQNASNEKLSFSSSTPFFSFASVMQDSSSFSSLLSNATGDSIIVRPSSGLHPIRSALCACQYLVDAFANSSLRVPKNQIKLQKAPSTSATEQRVELAQEILEGVHRPHSSSASSSTNIHGSAENSSPCSNFQAEHDRQKFVVISLSLDSHLDNAHQHFLLNYLEKHFGPRLCTYLHALDERTDAENNLTRYRSEKKMLQKSKKNNSSDETKTTNEKEEEDKEEKMSPQEENLASILLAKNLGFAKCRSRLQEAVCLISTEIRAKPYSVSSNLCLADVMICSFFARINLKEICDLGSLLNPESYERLKWCLHNIQSTVRAGLNQCIAEADEVETKAKLEALRKRLLLDKSEF